TAISEFIITVSSDDRTTATLIDSGNENVGPTTNAALGPVNRERVSFLAFSRTLVVNVRTLPYITSLSAQKMTRSIEASGILFAFANAVILPTQSLTIRVKRC